jgi:hypothetical protein
MWVGDTNNNGKVIWYSELEEWLKQANKERTD